MKRLLICLLCMLPISANAEIIYRTQRTGSVPGAVEDKNTFANEHRFYFGAMYNYTMWQNDADDTIIARGKNETGFDATLGVRVSDTFRIEGNYMYNHAKWDIVSLNTNTVFMNAIVDARIDSLYRLFYNQKLVPYVGAGAGLTWYNAKDVEIKNDANLSLAAMAGLGIEFGEYFALDLGYRYVYMFTPKVDVMPDLVPSAHQIRFGARVNF